MEQEALYELFGSPSESSPAWNPTLNARMISLPGFLCPTDTGKDIPFQDNLGNTWARGNYAVNGGPCFWDESLGGARRASTCSQSPFGTMGSASVMGVSHVDVAGKFHNWSLSLSELNRLDGTASTLLASEIRIGVDKLDRRGVWAMGFPGSSITCANVIGDCTVPNDPAGASDDVEGCNLFDTLYNLVKLKMGCWNPCPSFQAQARSQHAGGGVQITLADGSTRWVRQSISQRVWYCYVSATDGEPLPE
jgi:hypothetical protein